MAKEKRVPARLGLILRVWVALALLGWSGPTLASRDAEALLAPFLSCTSPTAFVEAQQRVDMPRLVEALDDWHAVRLGALGPVREDAAALLNRKRAAFLVTVTEKYGAAKAEVLALFLLHSATDDDLKEVLGLLARDKRLGDTLGRMGTAREELERRGLKLSDHPDRDFELGDVTRGARRAGTDILDSSPLHNGSGGLDLSALREQLPPPYQRALDEVWKAETERHFSPGNVARGSFDTLTFGVPLGFYGLAAGTSHGAYSLSQGEYERAARELTPAALLVALYAGGRAVGTLETPEPRARLSEVVTRLEERLGGAALDELARYIQAHREAGRLVAVGGEEAAVALHEARGDVARAQAWLSRAQPPRTGPTMTSAGAGKGLGIASLTDEGVGLTAEVVDTKLARVELDATGPRLSGNVAVLEKQRPALDAPPREAQGNPLWSEYVAYWEKRLAELKQGTEAKPPLAWAGYGTMRGQFARGLAFERAMVEMLRADAALPKAQRRFLQDFDKPRIEAYVGVKKPDSGLRFADVLVIEEGELSGMLRRVETFSFKSRDLSQLKGRALTAQMTADASEALRYYGETLNIRRPSLELRNQLVTVRRVRLIYEGGRRKPEEPEAVRDAVLTVQENVKGVEVLFQ